MFFFETVGHKHKDTKIEARVLHNKPISFEGEDAVSSVNRRMDRWPEQHGARGGFHPGATPTRQY